MACLLSARRARGHGGGGGAPEGVVGDDVFRLVADPRLGVPLAMDLVITLDEMFGAAHGLARSLLPRTWSV